MNDAEVNRLIDKCHLRTFRKTWSFLHPKHPELTKEQLKRVMKKRRFRYSRECYKIDGREGNLFILKAKDGNTMLAPRYRLLVLGAVKPNNIKWASTIEGVSKGVVTRIIGYDKDKQKYTVMFDDGDGRETKDVIPVRNLRERFPTVMSKLERDFFKDKR